MRKRQILKQHLMSYFCSEFKRCLQVIFHFLKPWETIHVAADKEKTPVSNEPADVIYRWS